MQQIAERIKGIREDADMTQKQFASAVNISEASFKNYESGRRDIPARLLRNIAEAFNVSMDYLVGLTDIPYAIRSEVDELANLYYTLNEYDKQRVHERMLTLHENYKKHPKYKEKKK